MLGTVGVVLSVIGLCGLVFELVVEWKARRAGVRNGYDSGGSRLAYLGAMVAVVLLGLLHLAG